MGGTLGAASASLPVPALGGLSCFLGEERKRKLIQSRRYGHDYIEGQDSRGDATGRPKQRKVWGLGSVVESKGPDLDSDLGSDTGQLEERTTVYLSKPVSRKMGIATWVLPNRPTNTGRTGRLCLKDQGVFNERFSSLLPSPFLFQKATGGEGGGVGGDTVHSLVNKTVK